MGNFTLDQILEGTLQAIHVHLLQLSNVTQIFSFLRVSYSHTGSFLQVIHLDSSVLHSS